VISSCFNSFSSSIGLLEAQSEDYERKEDNARKRQHRDFSAAPQIFNRSTGSDFGNARSRVGKDNQGNHSKGFYFKGGDNKALPLVLIKKTKTETGYLRYPTILCEIRWKLRPKRIGYHY
jgi:hypothetical protein